MLELNSNKQSMTNHSPEQDTSILFKKHCSQISRLVSKLNSLDSELTFRNSYSQQFNFLEKQAALCVLLNTSAEIIYLNSYGCELLGTSFPNYFGQCWLTNYILPEQRTEIAIVFEQMMKGFGESFSEYCNEIHTNHKSNITLEWQNLILRNRHNIILGSFSVGHQLGTSYEI